MNKCKVCCTAFVRVLTALDKPKAKAFRGSNRCRPSCVNDAYTGNGD
jgi:hypothetical protein